MYRRPGNEDKPQSRSGTVKPILSLISIFLLKHTISMRYMSNLPSESTCGHLSSGSKFQWHWRRKDCTALCLHHWGTGVLATQTQQKKMTGDFIHWVPTLHPKLDSSINLGKWVCITQHILSAQFTHVKETSIWSAFTVTKLHGCFFLHN